MKYYSNKTADVDEAKNLIKISFACSDKKEWADILTKVKTLEGRRYNEPFPKSWSAKVTDDNITALTGWGFKFKKAKKKEEVIVPEVFDKHKTVEIPEEGFELLYDYQKEALQFIAFFEGRGLVSLPMGSGKTFVALYYLKLFPVKRPVLIVCPAPIKLQWKRECKKVLPETVSILDSKSPYLPAFADIYIINWDILEAWKDVLCRFRFEVIIADEVQAIGSSKSKRTKAYRAIVEAQDCDHIPMSGTPFNKVRQFYNVLNLLAPKKFPSEWKFWNRYCDPTYGPFGIKYDGASNIGELRSKITRIMYRKEKHEIFGDGLKKKRIVVPMEVDQKKFKILEDKLEDDGYTAEGVEALQRSAFYLKQDSIYAWVNNFLESEDKLVICAWHRAVVEEMHKKFKNSVVVYGGMTTEKKEEAKEKFINDPKINLYILNIGACPGIDGLQSVCNNLAFVELISTESLIEQAEDRIDRIGQNSQPYVHYLVASGTVDERMGELLEQNSSISTKLLKGDKVEKISILESLKGKT